MIRSAPSPHSRPYQTSGLMCGSGSPLSKAVLPPDYRIALHVMEDLLIRAAANFVERVKVW